MRARKLVLAVVVSFAAIAALAGTSGCAAIATSTSGSGIAAPQPLAPANAARDAAGAANDAAKALQSDVNSLTPGK